MTGGLRVDDVLASQPGASFTQQQVAFARAVSAVTVALIVFDKAGNPESLCSASVVHVRVVLTAAHCVLKARNQSQRVTVVFGRARSRREVLDLILHPGFLKSARAPHTSYPQRSKHAKTEMETDPSKDLALVLLHRLIPEGYELVAPVPRGFRDRRTSTKLIAGFGAARASQAINRLSLRFAELLGNSRLDKGVLTGTDEIFMESRYSNGTRVNVCSGDSGGPLLVIEPGGSSLRQLGVTSAADEDCRESAIFAPIDAERATLRLMFDSLMQGEQGADQNPF